MWRKLFTGEEEEEDEKPFREPHSELKVKKQESSEFNMAEEMLVHKRGLVRAKITRIRNSLRKLEADQQQASLPQLRVFTKSMDTHYKEYNQVQDEILSVCVPSGRGAHEEKYEEFEVLFNETSLTIERLKDVLAPPPGQAIVPMQAAGQQQVIVQQQPLRAPFPTFDGQYENWPRFKAMFQDLMRRSPDCDAIKLYHLEKSLIGTAAGVIDSQTI